MAALVLVALVPAICVLWFMGVAMRNERLAVEQRLTEVYATHLVSLQLRVMAFVRERQARLQPSADHSPAETFAALVRAGLADSVLVFGEADRPAYPSAAIQPAAAEESPEWAVARSLEFQRNDYEAAAQVYARIAQSGANAQSRARALQSEAANLLKSGRKDRALARLNVLIDDASLREAVSMQGMSIVPNAQLLVLKTADPGAGEIWSQTLDDLVDRLNDYTDASIPSAQRRFLMEEVKVLAPGVNFPTLAAESLAADYLDRAAEPSSGSGLSRTALENIWRLPSAGGRTVALMREDRFLRDLAAVLDPLALPDVGVTVLPPGRLGAAALPLAPMDVGVLLPGWKVGLNFRNGDPRADASARQTRFYLWTGVGVIVIIPLLSLLVARYVGAQMRLARMKDELASTISHELKTPLASMRVLVDTLLADRCTGEAQRKEYLGLVAKENLRLSQLIENFLTYSRIERGQLRLECGPVEPEAVARAAVDALRDRLMAPGCEFAAEIGGDLPAVSGDAVALTTVLVNLLDNACKYSNGVKRIGLRVTAGNGRVVFAVSDNGIGITPDETRRIFDRFYQVDQSLTKRHGGCGLGLSIVDRIVRSHGGTVEVESEPGRGSTFLVRIPVAKVGDRRAVACDAPLRPQNGPPRAATLRDSP